MEDAKVRREKGLLKHQKPEALYDIADATKTISKFESVDFHKQIDIAPNISSIFHRSGHILGSSIVEVNLAGKRIVFSGDLGGHNTHC
jgi:metallo-beta-lactamase family protein